MSINIKYRVEDLILIRKFYGNVTIEDLISSLNYMLENNLLTQDQKGVISDFSEASFMLKQNELLLLKDMFLKNYHILGSLKFAQIITTPKIAQTILFANDNSDVLTKSFSTFQAAKNWINQEL